MITNERGLFRARRKVTRLKALKTKVEYLSQCLKLHDQAASVFLQEAIEELTNEIRTYSEIASKKSEFPVDQLRSLADIPRLLVRARIELGWSQRDLAERVGMHDAQVSRYERTEYRGISLTKLQQITSVLILALIENTDIGGKFGC